MNRELVTRLIAFLKHRHKLAEAGHLHAPYRTETFIGGTRLGAAAILGLEISAITPIVDEVVRQHGFLPDGKLLHLQLKDRGLSAVEGAAELFAIEIEVWQRILNGASGGGTA